METIPVTLLLLVIFYTKQSFGNMYKKSWNRFIFCSFCYFFAVNSVQDCTRRSTLTSKVYSIFSSRCVKVSQSISTPTHIVQYLCGVSCVERVLNIRSLSKRVWKANSEIVLYDHSLQAQIYMLQKTGNEAKEIDGCDVLAQWNQFIWPSSLWDDSAIFRQFLGINTLSEEAERNKNESLGKTLS